MKNFLHDIYHIKLLIVASSYIVGMWFIFSGIFKLKKYGELRTMFAMNINISGPLLIIFSGIILFFLPSSIITFSNTIFYNVYSIKKIFFSSIIDNNLLKISFNLIEIIGYISFIKAWIQIARSGYTESNHYGVFGKSILSIVSSIICINIKYTIYLILKIINTEYL